ncbi:MAG: hypothetical protein JOZ70_14865 [Pseudolabrys sp.]|nr:hypothetical protein [Pseudolabrys sp.]MBV9956517.1 hypothetical protein [Pseudolabrys sp.]
MSYQLDSFFGKSDHAETTGSILQANAKAADLPPEQDLNFARTAVSDAFMRGNKDASVPWENPQTGARGTVTPLAAAYTENGKTCRDFLASYVKDRAESWLRGEACEEQKGKWAVRSLKPWTRS